MSIEDKFEKTRIQDPDKAQEEANMLRVEAGESPTAEDYDKALSLLSELEKKASQGSATVDQITRPLRNALAGTVTVGGKWLDLLALSITSMGPGVTGRESRRELIEILKQMPEDYKFTKEELSTAREKLEQWKKKAAAVAK